MIFATYQNLEEFLHPQSDEPSEKQEDLAEKDTVQRKPEYDDYNMVADIEVMPIEKEEEMVVRTNVISAAINGRKEKKELSEPIIYTLEHKSVRHLLLFFFKSIQYGNYEL